MDMNIVAQFSFIIPELLIVIGALVLLLLGVFSKGKAYPTVMGLAIAILVAALIIVCLSSRVGLAFGNALMIDRFTTVMKGLVLSGAIASLIMSVDFSRAGKFDKFEYPILCLFAVAGMLVMVMANNMLAAYLGLELQSLSLYCLAAFNRDNVRSSESGLKYFLLGSLSSGMLLYGISLLYGFTGCIGFHEIADYFVQQPLELGVMFAMAFIFAGLAFKISAVPFHMWTPDVYEGAPTAVTAFFATAPKIAAMALFTRITLLVFAPISAITEVIPAWQQIVIFMALASMLLSAFGGIGQKNIKRLLAYSSIGHIGYALVGLSSGTILGATSLVVYLIIYLISTIGCFAFVLAMRNKDGYSEDIYDLSGLAQTNPFMAIMMTIQLFSLASIPPLSGFLSKWYSFSAAVQVGLTPLAIVGMLASVVAAFYYIRLVKIMWFDEPKINFNAPAAELKIIMGVCGLFSLSFVLFGKYIYDFAQKAAIVFF